MSSGSPAPDDSARVVVWYFIDEAGTPTLFDRRGRKPLVGTEQTSQYFLLGKLEVADPLALTGALDELRKSLLADPYFRSVPSMQPEEGKTSIKFHAKDDLPEVREHVFRLLMRHEVRFAAVVRDKSRLLKEVLARNQAEPHYRYSENEIYDELVSQLFKTAFHQADHFELVFASRGEKDRSSALYTALQKAQQIYEQNFGIKSKHTVQVINSNPVQHGCLQAVDYFLWALQRLYEKGEDRFWTFVWPKVRVVHDLDDTRKDSFGTIYTPQKPLTKEASAKK
ncbi:MAG: DUF3800 domain-containing protein [Gemmataceae bacterium]